MASGDKNLAKCSGCDFIDPMFIDHNFYDKEARIKNNGTCQVDDDSGCKLIFSYGHEDKEGRDGKLKVWMDKNQHTCPPSKVGNIFSNFSNSSNMDSHQ